MNSLQNLPDSQIIIFGLAREGLSSYHFLRSQFADKNILLFDDNNPEALSDEWQTIIEKDSNVQTQDLASLHDLNLQNTLIIKTPGIPFSHPLLKRASKEPTCHLTSNTQLFFECANITGKESAVSPQIQVVGVTGTKGKSTTTSLLYHVLSQLKRPVYLAGNIGVPPLDAWQKYQSEKENYSQPPLFVLELSSHQLYDLPYSPNFAVILNVSPEHLDYYTDFEEYLAAKTHIASHQTSSDVVIFNPAHPTAQEIANTSPGKKITYSLENDSPTNGVIRDNCFFYQDQAIIKTSAVPLVGKHNWENIFPSVILGTELGLDKTTLAQAIETFAPLPHRLEFVAEQNEVQFYNDSQATTPEAVVAALASFPDKQIVLLAGGSDKGVSFDQLAQAVATNQVSTILLFPPTGSKIEAAIATYFEQNQLKNLPNMIHVESMQQAVSAAKELAPKKSVVLLSPACASFGLFKNYQDRGEQFRQAVLE